MSRFTVAVWLVVALSAYGSACGDSSGGRGPDSGDPDGHTGGDAEPNPRDSATDPGMDSSAGGNGGRDSGRDPALDSSVGGRDSATAMDAARDAVTDAAGGDVASAKVFFFGHSLVGHDMPQMIAAFARARGKTYDVNGQIGFGTALLAHWRWDGSFSSDFVPIGFPEELPGTLLFGMEGKAALGTGDYDVVVMTESAGFVDGTPGNWSSFCDPENAFGGCAIESVVNFVRLARMHNPSVRPILYTNWKSMNDTGGLDGWLTFVNDKLGWWENVADQAEAQLTASGSSGSPIRVVPAGVILARIVRQARDGELAGLGLPDQAPLFSDDVHITRLGFYIIALAHYAAIYRESPVGLPGAVDVINGDRTARVMDGFTVDAGLAAHFQQVVWQMLEEYPRSGVVD